MATSSRLRATLAGAAIITSAFAPVTARAAAPKVYCMQAYASRVPVEKCDPSAFRHLPPAAPDTITPISRVHGSNVTDYLGIVMVEGNATPGSQVAVSLTDGTKSIIRVATAAATSDPGLDVRAGDFEVMFDPRTDLAHVVASVQELGGHTAPNNTPTMANPTPADLGQTVLMIDAVAKESGVESEPLSLEIFKQPATPGDTFKPQFKSMRFPPEHWCHYSAQGAKIPGINQHMGGDTDGRCGTFSQSGMGAIPDATWVLCTRYTSRIPDQLPNAFAGADRSLIDAWDAFCDLAMGCGGFQCQAEPFMGYSMCSPHCDEQCARAFADQYSSLRSQYCRTDFDRSQPRGMAPLSGQVADNTTAANGIASEIASVTVVIKQGAATVRTYTDPFARITSTSGSWGWELNINDFAPTYPNGTPYTIVVTATDAWGNSVSQTSNPINVYPY
jgi:hypothetical protein